MSGKVPDDSLMGMSSFPALGRLASKGNKLATLISAFAFAFSAVSFYETVLKQPKIAVHVAPVVHYGRDSGGDIEVLALPMTIVNEGAQGGTILAMELKVENPKPAIEGGAGRVHYAAFFGEHPRQTDATNRAFAPVSVAGRSSFSDTVRFYPKGSFRPHIIPDQGTYRMTLTVKTAAPDNPSIIDRIFRQGDPAPLVFERTLPWISDQQLGMRRATIAMHAKDWLPAPATGEKR